MKKGLSSMVDASHNFERVHKEASCLSCGVECKLNACMLNRLLLQVIHKEASFLPFSIVLLMYR